MRIIVKNGLLIILAAFLVSSCSRKKDSFINRSWHAVGTEYNILYNGNLAFENGRNTLAQNYADNYWDILPIERMEIRDEVVLPGQTKNSDFERAEEKATKAIQMHSMNINGKEKNPQIDEAYLLLGKSRYFDQRFVPALEAFNYILFKYPASDKINQAKIWREKTNLRLENTELAIENLKRLLKRAKIEKQDLADATSTLAQAYINLKHYDSAAWELEVAANETKNNDERGRYRFIQGQLYNELGKTDSANIAFDKVIALNRKTPRIYLIAAHVSKAKNFDYDNGNKEAFLELLIDLEEDRENRPYLDKIYYRIAEYHRINDSDSLAEIYYNRSLRTNTQDKLLKANNYRTLGDMKFDTSQYKFAGAYYDSTLLSLTPNTKDYRSIKRKRDNLDDVIYYEEVAQRNDSILSLVAMTEDERLAKFTLYAENLKKQAEEQKAKEEADKLRRENAAASAQGSRLDPTRAGFNTTNTPPTSFYFYNPTTVAFGKNEFIQSWGERQLEDNWRWSNKSASALGEEEVDETIANASEEELYDPQFYIDRIPTEQKAIDSLAKDRNFAYYQLGLIYKEKFREYDLARVRLEELLKSDPEERLVLPSKYNLYKIYQELNMVNEAEAVKNDIITNYPDSRYATILLNPNSVLPEDEGSPENIYEKLYRQFENQEYEVVISECERHITLLDGEDIVPKFEFLKAVSKARLYGFEAYKEGVNYIALNYPNSPEGKKAENLMQTTIPLLENSEFIDDETATSFKVLYPFNEEERDNIEEFKKTLDQALQKVSYFGFSTSVDLYDKNTTFVVVHGLNTIEGALGFEALLKDRTETKIAKDHVAISSQNYQIVQIFKNLDSYLKLE